jgi:hypothetical protein
MNHPRTILGIENREIESYRPVLAGSKLTVLGYDNPEGSIGVCREELRRFATAKRRYRWCVVTDDNAVFTEASLEALVRCAKEWPEQPCVAQGFHAIQKFFQQGKEGKRPQETTRNGLTSFEGVSHIFQCYPANLYRRYHYPASCLTYDDRHFTFWALTHRPAAVFRICVQAEFNKARHRSGGSGTIDERLVKCGKSLIPLAQDFPLFMGSDGVNHVKWRFVMKLAKGFMYGDRPPGGSRRKDDAVLASMVKRSV